MGTKWIMSLIPKIVLQYLLEGFHLSQNNILEQSIESHWQLHSHPLVLQHTCIKNNNNIMVLNFNLFIKKKKKNNNNIMVPCLIIPQSFIDISSSLLLFDFGKGEEIKFDIGKVRENE